MSKLAFQFGASRDNSIGIAHINLYFYNYDSDKYLGDEVLEVSAQNDPSNKCWYALHYKVNAKSPAELAQAARLAARLEKAIITAHEAVGKSFGYWGGFNPVLVVEAARTLAVLVVNDERSGHWLPPANVAPPEWVAYSEDYEAAGLQGHFARVILPPDRESSAKEALAKLFVQENELTRLEKWAKAGFPVKVWHNLHAPRVRPPAEQIRSVEWRGEE